MNITPITGPRTAQVLGAKTVASESLRQAAIDKFNSGLQVQGSPSQAGAVLDPSNAPPAVETQPVTPSTPNEALSAATPEASETNPPTQDQDLEAKRIASHYANLARKEKALRMREAQIRRFQASQATPAQSQTPAFDATKYVSRDELVQNPFGVLNNLGLTYEQLTQKALDAPTAEDLEQRREIAALKSELQAIKSAQANTEKTFQQTQTMARRQAELQIHQDVSRLVAQDPTFEVTRANNAQRDITRLITEVYDKGMGPEYPRGTILDVTDAAQMVENELTQRAMRMASLKKIQQRLQSTNTAPQKPNTQQQPTQQSALRTLTNNVGTSTRKLTPRERALAAFRGEAV
jgi:hypothetical protein